MARTPSDDRSAAPVRNEQRPRPAANQRPDQPGPVDASAGRPRPQAQQDGEQQRGVRGRWFAPGEDGECH